MTDLGKQSTTVNLFSQNYEQLVSKLSYKNQISNPMQDTSVAMQSAMQSAPHGIVKH